MNDVFSSIRRTPYQSLASFLILFFTLFLASFLFVAINFLDGLLAYVETRPQVIVYFQNSTTEDEIFTIRDELMESGKVREIAYISKEEAYDIYKELTQDNPLLIEMTSSDILPASIEIYATKPEFLREVAEFLETKEGVDEVQFQEVIVDKLLNLTQTVRAGAAGLFSFLIFMTVIVIITTISFKIALKKNEIEIMKLLGASNWYIKRPFLLEAMTIGFFAGITACSVLFIFMFVFYGPLSSYLIGIDTLVVSLSAVLTYKIWPLNPVFISLTYSVIVLFGFLISFTGSYLATKKYLG